MRHRAVCAATAHHLLRVYCNSMLGFVTPRVPNPNPNPTLGIGPVFNIQEKITVHFHIVCTMHTAGMKNSNIK